MSEITLYNDDCINVLKNIKDKTIDLICTDIPYELENHGGTNSEFAKRCARMRDSVDFMAYGIDYDSVFLEFIRVCKIPNMIIFCSNLQVGKIISFFQKKGLKTDVLVWEKSNPAPMCNGKYMSDLEYIIYVHDKGSPFNNDTPFEFKKKCKIYPIVVSNDKVHPTQKPLKLIDELVTVHSFENQLVLDPFMGSGTCGIVCASKDSIPYTSGIGYFASFGGRYFQGGYGRDAKGGRCIYNERLRNAKEQANLLKGIEFNTCSFENYNPNEFKNCLFYLDPPYYNTKEYENKFDYEKFYNWCEELGKENYVFISEYYMPSNFQCIWSKERMVLQKSDREKGEVAIEKLFTIGKSNTNNLEKDIFDL